MDETVSSPCLRHSPDRRDDFFCLSLVLTVLRVTPPRQLERVLKSQPLTTGTLTRFLPFAAWCGREIVLSVGGQDISLLGAPVGPMKNKMEVRRGAVWHLCDVSGA